MPTFLPTLHVWARPLLAGMRLGGRPTCMARHRLSFRPGEHGRAAGAWGPTKNRGGRARALDSDGWLKQTRCEIVPGEQCGGDRAGWGSGSIAIDRPNSGPIAQSVVPGRGRGPSGFSWYCTSGTAVIRSVSSAYSRDRSHLTPRFVDHFLTSSAADLHGLGCYPQVRVFPFRFVVALSHNFCSAGAEFSSPRLQSTVPTQRE